MLPLERGESFQWRTFYRCAGLTLFINLLLGTSGQEAKGARVREKNIIVKRFSFTVTQSMNMKCGCMVCKGQQYKYKCPTCLLKYCSVTCFKKHKEPSPNGKFKCRPKGRGPKVKRNKLKHHAVVTEDSDLCQSDEEETEDKVPKERLNKLGECDELKGLLENPHLQNMLQHMDSSTTPAQDIHKAMLEPIFTEFADCCLRVVKPERYTQES